MPAWWPVPVAGLEHMFENGGVTATVADLRALLERAQPGAVRVAADPGPHGAVLPVLDPLRPLFPAGGLRRGSTVEVAVQEGAVGVGSGAGSGARGRTGTREPGAR